MSAVTLATSVQIVWDDSVVIIFQFTDSGGNTQHCGFLHFGIQAQTQSGSSTQVSQILTVTQQQGLQITNDPGTWVETVKYGARGTSSQPRSNCSSSTVSTAEMTCGYLTILSGRNLRWGH